MKHEIPFGAWVTCPDRYVRKEDHPKKTWVLASEKWASRSDAEPVSGLFIGTRTYNQGTLEWIGPDEGNAWRTTGTLEVGLIVPGPRLNPVPVPIDMIEEAKP